MFFTSFGAKEPSAGSALRSARSASSRQSIEANVAADGVPAQPDGAVVVVVGVVLVVVLVAGRAVELVVGVVVLVVVGPPVEVVVVDVVVVVVLVVEGGGKVPNGASYAPMSHREMPSLLPSTGRGWPR
jgi:hypothetical protein